jgi:rhomboid family GlyGly-CTERM serine protease
VPLAAEQPVFYPRTIYVFVAISVVAMTVFQAMPLAWQDALRYDREAIALGEVWRLVTGHFVHLGWSHLSLNLAGLVLGTWLFAADRAPAQWLLATFVSALACGAGLWLFSPEVRWCVGLSGVLHGLMVVGFGGWMLGGDRWAVALLAVVVGKLAWEQAGGAMPWESTLSGGWVVTDAHLWGALGGAAYLVGERAWAHRP